MHKAAPSPAAQLIRSSGRGGAERDFGGRQDRTEVGAIGAGSEGKTKRTRRWRETRSGGDSKRGEGSILVHCPAVR